MKTPTNAGSVRPRGRAAFALALVAVLVLTGCASPGGRSESMKRADAYARLGEWDNAITYYQEVLNEQPDDRTALSQLKRAKTMSSNMHRVEGNRAAAGGDLHPVVQHLIREFRTGPTLREHRSRGV